jgi:DNA-binding CsgD family transcriptional regulator/tetratricopeptide (TPR) repeat protein
MAAAVAAGRLAPAAGPAEVALTVLAGPRAEPGHRGDTLLDAAALMVTGGAGAAAQALRVVRALAREPAPGDEVLRRGWLAGAAAVAVWDDDSWDALTRRHLDAARGLHALDVLSPAVQQRALVEVLTGDLAAAAALLRAPFPQAAPVPDAGGAAGVPHGLLGLLAVRGRVEEADPVLVRCLDLAVVRGDGLGFATAHWARAVLSNALGDYETAVAAAREATASRLEPGPPGWALAELAEAAVRTGDEDTARAATQELTGTARASGTEWALGVAASRQALLQGGDGAERLHGEAVERLAGTRMCLDLARARLLRGEWLRREGRRVDARAELRSAADAFAAMGAAAFADRARRELLATGETVRRRTADTTRRLTAQEGHIARLVARGSTNPEIAAALFISPRTVEWHVRRIFTKLGVGSRREVRRALGDADPDHDPGPWSGPGWGPGPSTGPTGPGTQEAS